MTNKQLAKKLEKPFKKEMKHYAERNKEIYDDELGLALILEAGREK